MLVVNPHELIGYLVEVEFLLVAGGKGIDKRLAFVVVGNSGDQFLAGLFDGRAGAVLDQISRTDKLHQRPNIRFFRGVNGTNCLRRGSVVLRRGRALRYPLHGVLRRSLNHQEKSAHVNNDQRKDHLHDFLRGCVARVRATMVILGKAAQQRDGTPVQACRVVHWPSVQVGSQDKFLLGCLAMSKSEMLGSGPLEAPAPAEVIEREAGLQRSLTPGQLAMIGLGSTIGTGLFLGSAISVRLAGPAVILSFVGGACIAVTMMWALAEMAAAHPAAGSFGLYAEMYLHPWAGYAVRLTYWFCMMVVVGSEVAASIYCKLWFPETPSWI